MDILEEIRQLKERVSALESKKVLCYETVLNDVSIEPILKSKDELYIQMCDYILKHKVVQYIDDKIYIAHKGSLVKGNPALKDLFIFVEKKWIEAYLKIMDDLNAEQFETYNSIIYGLNLNKSITKIKKYMIDKIKDNI